MTGEEISESCYEKNFFRKSASFSGVVSSTWRVLTVILITRSSATKDEKVLANLHITDKEISKTRCSGVAPAREAIYRRCSPGSLASGVAVARAISLDCGLAYDLSVRFLARDFVQANSNRGTVLNN